MVCTWCWFQGKRSGWTGLAKCWHCPTMGDQHTGLPQGDFWGWLTTKYGHIVFLWGFAKTASGAPYSDCFSFVQGIWYIFLMVDHWVKSRHTVLPWTTPAFLNFAVLTCKSFQLFAADDGGAGEEIQSSEQHHQPPTSSRSHAFSSHLRSNIEF